MAETESYLQRLLAASPLQEQIHSSAIRALHLPAGSRGLDAGCGIGLQAMQLAETVGSAGHVIGLDSSPEFLHYAEENVRTYDLSKQISFKKGDVRDLPFEDDTFDWAWSASCIGYAPIDPLPPMKELIRVVKPAGIVAIIAWSSEQLLPGYPLLEARLSATAAGIAPYVHGMDPRRHFLRALDWYRELGMEEIKAQVFADSVYAPLSEEKRRALISLFAMRWEGAESELAPDDREEFRRLCSPDSPDFILNLPDYYAFFTYSMFWGEVPG
ncbi:MAG: class I SAM-dependent methyltransferase [bacterium]|nr:MAG: class I SAM-dependent methyltransferase [bacterium]